MSQVVTNVSSVAVVAARNCKSMNYQNTYNNIINKARSRILTCYKERHHVIPICMNGSNDKVNLVYLTGCEHFICHELLAEIYPTNNKLKYAIWAMMNLATPYQQRYKVTARTYERLKIDYSKILSETHLGLKHTEEYKKQRSEAMKGANNPNYGKPDTALRLKTSKPKKSLKGRKCSRETIEKIRIASTGRFHTEEQKQREAKLGDKNPNKKGHKHSEQAKQNMSESKRKSWQRKKQVVELRAVPK